MEDKQSYERRLAEKLEHLRPPGSADEHWPQMKELLDRRSPKGGTRWWLYGIIAGLLLIGGWVGSNYIDPSAPSVAATTEQPSPASSGEMNKTVTQPNDPPPDNVSVKGKEGSSSELTPPIAGSKTSSNQQTDINLDKNSTQSTSKQPAPDNYPTIERTIADESTSNKTLASTTKADEGSVNVKRRVVGKNVGGKTEDEADARAVSTSRRDKSNYNAKVKPKRNSLIENKEVPGSLSVPESFEEVRANIHWNTMEDLTNAGSPSLLASTATPAALPNTAARLNSRFKTNSDRVKALKNRSVGTGNNKNFAVGLSLPLAFPLSDQRAIAYNFNGGANTVVDYIPSPHAQYHFNTRSYIQAELQFISPQFIQPALLSQYKYDRVGSTNYRQGMTSIFARKLYYFNLPVAVHYSPFKHFYLGSGLQFSSLMSGIAQFEDRAFNPMNPGGGDSLISTSFRKFGNDSLSGKLNGNEFRLLMDANYYWERFTVGLRYNQALSNYISLRSNANAPLFTDKNKSIQFYLRYNLWEDRKKKKGGLMANR